MKFFTKKTIAEFIGTYWLVLGGCGAAVLAGHKIGYAGIALAFGLTVLTMAFAISHISGCHLNPAVSVGLWAAGRFDRKELGPYIVAQVAGAFLASLTIWAIQCDSDSLLISRAGFAANGFGEYSPGGYGFFACMITEIIMTFIFLFVICGSTDRRAPTKLAPVAIGLCLTLIHLVGIPVTNLSVNPARSTGPALVQMIAQNPYAFWQLWFFWLMPIIGALAAGYLYKKVFDADDKAKE